MKLILVIFFENEIIRDERLKNKLQNEIDNNNFFERLLDIREKK